MSNKKHNCKDESCEIKAIVSMAENSMKNYCQKIGKKNISDLTYIEIISAMYESLGVPEHIYNPTDEN